jgi:Zn-dependent metalloprotease/uncharacterized protein YegL
MKRGSGKKGHPIRNTFIILFVLLLAVTASACALTYTEIFEVPFVSESMAKIGLLDSDANGDVVQQNSISLDGTFTNQKVTDVTSAMEVARDGAEQLSLGDALDDLSEIYTETIEDQTYYRLQQNYNGIPVYGRSAIVLADKDGKVMGMTTNAIEISRSLSIEPTVDRETIKSKVGAYASKNWDSVTSVTISAYDKNDLVIYPTKDAAVLAYCLEADSYEIIVDANSGDVLTAQSMLSNVSKKAYNSDKSKTFKALFQNDTYYAADEKNNIYIFYMDGNSEKFTEAIKEVVSSDNSVFGDTDDEKEKGYDTAVDILKCIQNVQNEFDTRLGCKTPYGLVKVFYNDSYENGRNAKGGNASTEDRTCIGIMYLGYELDVLDIDALDVIVHEYTHIITRERVDWTEDGTSKKQTESINEGISDLFAIMSRANIYNEEPTWEMQTSDVCRSAIDPQGNGGYPATINDKNKSKENDGHAYATITSRAGYLMYNGGSNGNLTKIPLDILEMLWYRSLYYLPSNANFSDLRNAVVETAGFMNFTENQIETVKNAFKEVGIEESSNALKCDPKLKIQVTDKNSENYDNYSINITGTQKKLFGDSDYEDTFLVSTEDAYELKLPNGSYTITVTDGADNTTTKFKNVVIRRRYSEKILSFNTNFGFDYTVAPGAQMTVLDFNGESYDNYQAEASGQTLTGGILNLDEGGYRVTLTDSKNNNRTKTFSLRIKSGKSNSLSIHTDFGKFNTDAIPDNALSWNGHYYYAVTQAMTWYDAEKYCEQIDGYLVTITSEEENNVIKDYISQTNVANRDFWIGATDEEDEGNFAWVTGEDFIYSNWGRNEPDDGGGQDHTIISNYTTSEMSYSVYPGEWDDVNGEEEYFFICEWGAKDQNANAVQQENSQRSFSDERNVALIIDNSGSMAGSPLESTQNAASQFVQQLNGQAGISLTVFENSSEVLSDFTTDIDQLNSVISDMNAGGGTNIEAGLKSGFEMLKEATGSAQKYIVLMSDGMPNDGKESEELISYAESIRDYDDSNDSDHDVIIYTLGFFDDLNDSEKVSAQNLLEQIADTGHHFEVADESDLAEFFTDIANEINGTKYIYVRIACPVDVIVTKGGETLSSSERSKNTRTSFGSLTFEQNEDEEDTTKILRLVDDGSDYDIEIDGTGRGTMDYTLGLMDENGNYSDTRKFTNISINRNTVVSSVAANVDKTVLKVDEDGDGKIDITYKAGPNEYGMVVDYTILYIILGVLCTMFVILILILIIYIRFNRRRSIL